MSAGAGEDGAAEALSQSPAVGKTGRLLVFRVRPGQDLVPTLTDACARAGIRSGIIVAAIGSLARATLVTVRPDATVEEGDPYTDPFVVQGPVELVSAQGFVSLYDDSGPMRVHLHGVLSRGVQEHFSGHFLEQGSEALFTVEVAVLEASGVELRRKEDDRGLAFQLHVIPVTEG